MIKNLSVTLIYRLPFIEVKGAEFNLKKRSHYDSLNAKIEEANSQIRNHRKYIYNEYDIVRENLHNIREKAQSGPPE